MFRAVHGLSNPLLIAGGQEKVMVFKEAMVFVAYFCGVYFSFAYGLEAVAYSFIGASFFDFFLTSALLVKVSGLRIRSFLLAWLPNVWVSVVCGGATYGISLYVDFTSTNYWMPIFTIMLILPPVWFLMLWVVRHPLHQELVRLLVNLKQKVVKSG
jgi:hypothetical protein